jgi:hypothetical protein
MTLPRLTSAGMGGERPRTDVDDSPFVAVIGRFVAWAGVALVGSLAILFASVVLGLAARLFLAVSGVAS